MLVALPVPGAHWVGDAALRLTAAGGGWSGLVPGAGLLTERAQQVTGGRAGPRRASAARGARARGLIDVQPERTLALWCPAWAVSVARRDDRALVDVPVAVVERGARGLVVCAASHEARAAGVTVGLRRREAEARCAGLVVVDRDPAAEARAFEAVARATESITPAVVLERPGVLTFPTRGPSRYFGGDDALAIRLLAIAEGAGVPDARVGIADGGFAARLATRAATTDRVHVVAPDGSPAFLAPWPVMALRDAVGERPEEGAAFADLLSRLGLRTLGDLAALPPSAVLARFGVDGAHAHRLASGAAEHVAPPTPPPPDLVEIFELDPPATRVDEAAFAAKVLADHLLARLEGLGLACDRVVVEAETEHGERHVRCWRHEGGLTAAALVDAGAVAARRVADCGWSNERPRAGYPGSQRVRP